MLIKTLLSFRSGILLQHFEEIPNFKDAVFRHVGAVDCVPNSIFSKFSSEGVRSEMFSYFRVMGTAELSELSNTVLLADFKSNAGAVGEVLNEG